MNKSILIVSIVVFLILLGIAIYFLLHIAAQGNPQAGTTSTSLFPISGTGTTANTGGNTMTVSALDGGSAIQTKDFLGDPGVTKNAFGNTGYDLIVGSADPAAPNPSYQIDYSEKDQSFGVTLYQEPLGTYRTQAEQDLQKRLGISQNDMCRLNYVLSVGPGVNDTYAGKNLGFSFCPGAVTLP